MTWKEFKTLVDGQLRTLESNDELEIETIIVNNCPNRLCVHVKNDKNVVTIHN
jgi:hypothetical protein